MSCIRTTELKKIKNQKEIKGEGPLRISISISISMSMYNEGGESQPIINVEKFREKVFKGNEK